MDNVYAKEKYKTKVAAASCEVLDETRKLSVSFMSGIAVLVGVWAALSCISAMISVGGPIELVQGWVAAVFGK